MKKRILCGILSIIMVLTCCLTLIFAGAKPQKETEVYAAGIEEKLSEKFDLIGINPTGYPSSMIEKITPFDSQKGQMMEGSSLVPAADGFGQVSGTMFEVNQFRLASKKSIYLWVYLFDTETFELTFTITDAGEKTCRWFFDSYAIQSAGAGWNLFELKASDAEVSGQNTNRYDVDYKTFEVRFKTELTENIEEYLGLTEENLSIYHVYVADSYLANPYSGKIDGLSKVHTAFSDDFLQDGRVFKGDEVELSNPYTIFEYLMVGKREYSSIQNTSNYIWELYVQEPSGAKITLDYGDKYSFSSKGYYTVNVQLFEKKKLLNQPIELQPVRILNVSKSVFCEEISLGSFLVGTTYEMKDNETLEVEFKLTPGIVISGDLSISFSNDCAELEKQYVENGIYYIQIKGLKKGTVEMDISASASSQYNKNVRKYKSEITIEVLSSEEENDFSLTILWITFGCFCAFFGGILINSLVKARKNDVK